MAAPPELSIQLDGVDRATKAAIESDEEEFYALTSSETSHDEEASDTDEHEQEFNILVCLQEI